MEKLIAFLWSGCWHKWMPTGQITDVYDTSFGKRSNPDFREMRYECDRCHRVKDMKI